jgi:hypothetical protein
MDKFHSSRSCVLLGTGLVRLSLPCVPKFGFATAMRYPRVMWLPAQKFYTPVYLVRAPVSCKRTLGVLSEWCNPGPDHHE